MKTNIFNKVSKAIDKKKIDLPLLIVVACIIAWNIFTWAFDLGRAFFRHTV